MITVNSSNFEQISIYMTSIFLFAVIVTASSMPLVNSLGIKFNVIDQPNKRKQHKKNIVRLGGLGIFIGFFLTILITTIISHIYWGENIDYSFYLPILFCSFSFYILGTGDDLFKLKPLNKLTFQIIIASIVYSLGVNFNAIDVSFLGQNIDPISIHKIISFILTILWIVGLTNAINWLDGLDGLASGISIFTCLGLLVLFLAYQNLELAFVVAALCGSSVGFLRFNFYPAKILMGDGGSYLLGSSLSIISIMGMTYNFQTSNSIIELKVLPLHILILLFFLPIIDLTSVIASRILEGVSPFYPDRRHIHHKILNTGMCHRDTVVILYGFSQLLICLSLFISDIPGKVLYLCISLIICILSVLYCINMKKSIDSNYEKT